LTPKWIGTVKVIAFPRAYAKKSFAARETT